MLLRKPFVNRWQPWYAQTGKSDNCWSWTGSREGFDRLPGAVILELRWTQVAERGVDGEGRR